MNAWLYVIRFERRLQYGGPVSSINRDLYKYIIIVAIMATRSWLMTASAVWFLLITSCHSFRHFHVAKSSAILDVVLLKITIAYGGKASSVGVAFGSNCTSIYVYSSQRTENKQTSADVR